MTKSCTLFAVVLLSAFFFNAKAQKTYAVVVGVSDYLTINDLRYADADAGHFYQLLRSSVVGDIPRENIIFLTNSQATKRNILRAMTLFQRATPRDRIIFYFSGHGDTGMLLPYDVSGSNMNSPLYDNEVKALFRQSAARTKLLLADACMAGTMRNRQTPAKPAAVSSTSTSNVIVLLSSRSAETSQETRRLQQGYFTYFLIKGANGEADVAPRNGTVTVKELYDYIRTNVRNATQAKQTPVAFGRFPDSLPFSITAR